MASRRNRDDRPTMIHCEYCGEDYASTYKHCPFCDEMPLEDEDYDGDEDSVRRPRGGKRLVTNTRGGGYGRGPSPLRLIGIIISLAVIIAAIIIVISVIIPLVTKGNSANDPGTVESVMPTDSAQPSADPDPTESVEPVETIPADQTATDFSLSLTEFSLSNRYPDPVTLKVTVRRDPHLPGPQFRDHRGLHRQHHYLRRFHHHNHHSVSEPDGFHSEQDLPLLPGESERHLLHPRVEHRQQRRGHRVLQRHRDLCGQGYHHPDLHRGRPDSDLHRTLYLI